MLRHERTALANEMIADFDFQKGRVKFREASLSSYSLICVVEQDGVAVELWAGTLVIGDDILAFKPLSIYPFVGGDIKEVAVDICDPDGIKSITDSMRAAVTAVLNCPEDCADPALQLLRVYENTWI